MLRIYLRELWVNLKSLLVWTGLVLLLVANGLAKFAGFRDNPEVLKILESVPRGVLQAFGVQAFNLTTLEGFFGAMAPYLYLMGAMASALWAANAVAKEEFRKTAEFTLTLPLPRQAAFLAKALAALTTSLAFVLLTWAIALLGVRGYSPEPSFYAFLRLEMLGMVFLSLFAWALGLALAGAGRRPKQAALLAALGVLGAYLLATASSLSEGLSPLKWLTPFAYFDAALLYREGSFKAIHVALTLGAAVGLATLGYRAYGRRDLVL